VRRALSSKFDVLVSADRYRYEYENLIQATTALIGQRVDTTWNYAGSFGYRLGRTGRVGIGASYFDRSSTLKAVRSYNGLRFGSVVSFGL
jgi:hypothetical protein